MDAAAVVCQSRPPLRFQHAERVQPSTRTMEKSKASAVRRETSGVESCVRADTMFTDSSPQRKARRTSGLREQGQLPTVVE